jgi:MFS family permease
VGRTERSYYAIFAGYQGLAAAVFPIYPLFLMSRGLDLFEINAVLATFFVTIFVFEVPTGAVADLFGRKVSFLLACAVRCGAFYLYAFADGFLDCIIAEVFDAIGTTLASGSLEAWLVDGMHEEGDERPADRVFARSQVIARVVGIATGIAGAYLADVDITLVWFLAGSGFVVTGVFAALWMHEKPPEHPRVVNVFQALSNQVHDGVVAARDTPMVRMICLLTFLSAFAFMPVNLTWPPRLLDLSGEGYWVIGWVWAFVSGAAAAGSALTTRALRITSREQLLFVSQLFRGGMILLAAWATGFYPVLMGILLAEFALSLGQPAVEGWINEHIESKRRATVLSVWSMSFTLGGAAGCLSLGLLANLTSISTSWVAAAAIFALAAPGYLRLRKLAEASPALDRPLESPPLP